MNRTRVLFICTGNACRSQMAEGRLRHLAGDRFEVFSAGTHPWYVHPLAIEVMREQGIDISGHHSKSVDEFAEQYFDYVITTCDNARDFCPIFPGNHERIHWSIDDPIYAQGGREERLEEFRRVRDEIAARIEGFVEQTLGCEAAHQDP